MRFIYIALLSCALSGTAFAGFDSKSAYECLAENGTRFLVNDSFSGEGKALVSGKRQPLYAVGVQNQQTGLLHVLVTSGERLNDKYSLRLDVRNLEETSRLEGRDLVTYLYVPAELEAPSFWSGSQTVPAKCFQLAR